MICADCIHYEVCSQFSTADGATREYYTFANLSEKCECFKDKSEWVHLPCKVGDTMYIPIGKIMTEYKIIKIEFDDMTIWATGFNPDYCIGERYTKRVVSFDLGRTVFLTRKEAEKALAERRKDNADRN